MPVAHTPTVEEEEDEEEEEKEEEEEEKEGYGALKKMRKGPRVTAYHQRRSSSFCYSETLRNPQS